MATPYTRIPVAHTAQGTSITERTAILRNGEGLGRPGEVSRHHWRVDGMQHEEANKLTNYTRDGLARRFCASE